MSFVVSAVVTVIVVPSGLLKATAVTDVPAQKTKYRVGSESAVP